MDKEEIFDRLIDEFAIETASMDHEGRLCFIDAAYLNAYKTKLSEGELNKLTYRTCKMVEEKLHGESAKFGLLLTRGDIQQVYPLVEDNKDIVSADFYWRIREAYMAISKQNVAE